MFLRSIQTSKSHELCSPTCLWSLQAWTYQPTSSSRLALASCVLQNGVQDSCCLLSHDLGFWASISCWSSSGVLSSRSLHSSADSRIFGTAIRLKKFQEQRSWPCRQASVFCLPWSHLVVFQIYAKNRPLFCMFLSAIGPALSESQSIGERVCVCDCSSCCCCRYVRVFVCTMCVLGRLSLPPLATTPSYLLCIYYLDLLLNNSGFV